MAGSCERTGMKKPHKIIAAGVLAAAVLVAAPARAQEKSGPLAETYNPNDEVGPSAYEAVPAPDAHLEAVPSSPQPTIPQTRSEELAPWKAADEGDLEGGGAAHDEKRSALAFGNTEDERRLVFERVDWATESYEDLINGPDRGVPEWLLKEARCVAVIPHVVKAAFLVGVDRKSVV